MLGRRITKCGGRHGQDGAPVVAVWGCGTAACRRFPGGRRRCGSGVCCPPVHGLPAYQRRGGMASGHAPRTHRHGDGHPHRSLTPCSLVRRTRLAWTGTRNIGVRRILLGHSLPSPPAQRHHPPPVSTGTT
ncbi:hypothetical protein STAFG_6187 [Streptomyces afghaniensis 772]|uniref:Uncharacterized protein n=1 Tax=Streptomyces afghaniensis 772 TaxID=1283301 RepID=S4MMF3_9ACTN|nr:hypothetical protein STAFG_6187 [Streptomyces afghaniensis 772]